MALLLLQLLRRLLRCLGWPRHQAVFFETQVFGSSISPTLGTYLPSAVSSGRHFQQLYAVIRKYQAKVTSLCQKREYGSTRSVVRRLGTILSLEPCPRPYFQFVQDLSPLDCDEQSAAPASVAPSLADVLWVANDEGQACTRLRTELRRKEKNTTPPDLHPCLNSTQSIPKNGAQKDSVDQAALQKISALEDELTFLRAQIAAIVSAQTLGSIPSQAFKTLNTPDGCYPLPAMTSTPLSVSHNHFVIPSPPPLPSGAPSGVDASNSALALIKQRRASRNSVSSAADSTDHQRTKNIPSMMDVLKDLNKVQLRAVERQSFNVFTAKESPLFSEIEILKSPVSTTQTTTSPGGTPVSRPKKTQSSDWDPVALLTHALKQKFAHKNDEEDDSLDKENNSFDCSPFSSPEVPMVGRCSLKSNAKPSLSRTDGVKQAPAWKARAHI